MAGSDLAVVPVVDGEERPIGVVTVDDVLEVLLASPSRRLGIVDGSRRAGFLRGRPNRSLWATLRGLLPTALGM